MFSIPRRERVCRASITVLLLVVAGLLATASSSTSPPPPAQMPGNEGPGASWGQEPSEMELPSAYQYRGPHPVHPDFGSGFCDRQDEHSEPYAPLEPELFSEVDGAWVFVGDPMDFNYEGSAYWYANPHPLPEEYGGDWCHYPWPHRHHFLLDGASYDLIGGVVYFVGAFTDLFLRGMHRKRSFFHGHYRESYLQGAVYHRHRPRYARVGPNRYRRLLPRSPDGAGAFRPFRPARQSYSRRPSLTRRPGGATASGGSSGLQPRPDRSRWQGRQSFHRRSGDRAATRRGELLTGRGMPLDGTTRPPQHRSPRPPQWSPGGSGGRHAPGRLEGGSGFGRRSQGAPHRHPGGAAHPGWRGGGRSPAAGSFGTSGHSRAGSSRGSGRSGSSARSSGSGRSGSSARSSGSGRSGSSRGSGRSGSSGGSGRSGGRSGR